MIAEKTGCRKTYWEATAVVQAIGSRFPALEPLLVWMPKNYL